MHSFSFPTDIRMGPGLRFEIGKILRDKGYNRPLLVGDRAVAKLDFYDELLKHLKSESLDVVTYSDFQGNPIEDHVTAGTEVARTHRADSLVIVGGGAALDVGKAIALMVNHNNQLFDFEDIPGAAEATEEIPFMVTVPTTAGTGSEVGRSSVISENVSKAKKIIFSPHLLPPLVVLDPELTVGLPKSITAATGMDALTHLIEAFLAKGYHPMCDGIALEGIRMVGDSLVKAYRKPGDLAARGEMLVAAMMGAVAFQKGLGVNHSCAHALSTVYDLHHGLANSMMLRACMAFNMEAVPDRFVQMARVVGILDGDQESVLKKFLQWIENLQTELDINHGLGKYGVEVTDLLLDVACADVCHPLGPRPVSRQGFQKLFEESL